MFAVKNNEHKRTGQRTSEGVRSQNDDMYDATGIITAARTYRAGKAMWYDFEPYR
jgi:hypothetical protein